MLPIHLMQHQLIIKFWKAAWLQHSCAGLCEEQTSRHQIHYTTDMDQVFP